MVQQQVRVLRVLNEELEQTVARLQLLIFQNVTTSSPVDTGYMRGGFEVGFVRDERRNVPPPDRSARATQGIAAFSRNRIASQRIARTYVLANGTVHIQNLVPYAGILNQGTSAQAPAMFVEAAVDQAIRSLG